MHVVLLETSGNQPYIFGTNRLRENVGASQLTYLAGSRWVREAVKAIGCAAPQEPIERQQGDHPVEIVLATSGKAVLLVEHVADGHAIIEWVTTRALHEAPGIDLVGTVSASFAWKVQGGVHAALAGVHRRFEEVKSRLPGPTARFLRLPIVADCSSSGRPAAHLYGPWLNDEPDDDWEQPFSAESYAKRHAAGPGYERLRTDVVGASQALRLPANLRKLELALEGKGGKTAQGDDELAPPPLDWLGVVHVDGNGLGQVFLGFDTYAGTDNRTYVDRLRELSHALDRACVEAFREAAVELWTRTRATYDPGAAPPLALVPLVLGGDDMTALCDGAEAIRFASDYLDAFERLANAARSMAWANGMGLPYLTACAGVAIVKPHFPFAAAYELSEALLRSAKRVKQLAPLAPGAPVSALDFHVLYDASGSHLDGIHARLTLEQPKRRLFHRPYLVGPEAPKVAPTSGLPRLEGLAQRVALALARDDAGRRQLPSTQLHALRQALFGDHGGVQTYYDQIRHRYATLARCVGWSADGMPVADGKAAVRIFGTSPADADGERTLLLDVLEAMPFLAPAQLEATA